MKMVVGLTLNDFNIVYRGDEEIFVTKHGLIVYKPYFKDGLDGCLSFIDEHLNSSIKDMYFNSDIFTYKELKKYIASAECHNLETRLSKYEMNLMEEFL